MADLHPFVVYGIVGVWAGTLLAWLGCTFAPALSPTARARLWSIPLLAPPILYGLGLLRRHWLPCLSSSGVSTGGTAEFLAWLCRAGAALGRLLAPVLAVALAVGLLKAVASLWLAGRLVAAGAAAEAADARVCRAVKALTAGGPGPSATVVTVRRRLGQAFTVGLWRPVIVLSQPLVDGLDDEELEAVLAHELTHVSRGDHYKKWLGVLLRDVLFFTGLSGVAFGRLQAQVECGADAEAAAATGRPLALANAIIKSRKLGPKSGGRPFRILDNFLPALAGSDLTRRVERLVTGPPAPKAGGRSRDAAWVVAGLWGVVVSVALLVC